MTKFWKSAFVACIVCVLGLLALNHNPSELRSSFSSTKPVPVLAIHQPSQLQKLTAESSTVEAVAVRSLTRLAKPSAALGPHQMEQGIDLAASQSNCPNALIPGYPAKAGAFDKGCALAFIEQACTQTGADVTVLLATYLRTHELNVRKGLGRYNILNSKAFNSWCELPAAGREQALAIALTPKKVVDKVKAEANRDYMMYFMSDGNASVNAGGYAAASVQRRKLIAGSASQSQPQASMNSISSLRAGLPASASAWTNLSGYIHPVGRINDLLIDSGGSTSARTMWAGTDGGGIWKTTDGGTTWVLVNDFNGSLSIGKMLRSPRNTQEMYASTNPNGSHTYSPFGVMKSDDGGVTWTQLAQTNPVANPDWQYVTHLAIHPTGVAGFDVLLAATANGAYQSADSGATWTKISSSSEPTSFVGFHPLDGNRRAYTVAGNIVITSSGNWADAGTFPLLAGGNFAKFAFVAADVSQMYALLSASDGTTNLLHSINGGRTWAPLTAPSSFFYNGNMLYYTGALWVDPTNFNRLVVAEGWLASTADLSTATASTGWARSTNGWTDFHAVVADPDYNGTNNKIVYAMDDGGLYKFDDVDTLTGASYLATGMTITQAYSVSGRGGNVILGAQDVGPRVYRNQLPSDTITRWYFVENSGQCDGCWWIGDGATTATAHDNGAVMYGSRQFLDLFRSNDGGLTGTSICGTPPDNLTEGRCGGNYNASFIAPFVLDPNNPSTMLAGAKSLWRSTNVSSGIPSWSVIHTNGTWMVVAIAIAEGDSNVIWVGYADGRVFKTSNGQAASPSWSEIASLPAGSKAKILVDRTNVNRVFVGFTGFSGNKLYVSNDAGVTWVPVPGLPNASVMAMAQHPANPAWLYVGTAVGVFASQDGGATWSAGNEGPANVQIRDMNWYSESGNSADLLVATFGRGIWRVSIPMDSLIPPGAPGIGFVTPGDSNAVVAFTQPTYDGGSLITTYTATSSPGGFTATSAKSPIVVPGLSNGTPYTFTVTATNLAGTSVASAASASVTPVAAPVLSYPFALTLGWNLLGNSLNQAMPVASVYADPAVITSVWKWDTTTAGWQFYTPQMTAPNLQTYAASKGYDVLSVINPGEGYWVKAKTASSLGTQSGPAFSLTLANLIKGWNLTATGNNVLPEALNLSLSATPPAAGTVPINLTTLWAWDNTLAQWYFYAPNLQANGSLGTYVEGKGYLDFGQHSKTLGNGVGFWVNMP
jgi:hypothetical protein